MILFKNNILINKTNPTIFVNLQFYDLYSNNVGSFKQLSTKYKRKIEVCLQIMKILRKGEILHLK